MHGLWAFHNSHDKFYREPFGAVPCGQKILLRLKLYCPLPLHSVLIRLWKGEAQEEKVVMTVDGQEDAATIYRGTVKAPLEPGLLWYYFIIETKDNVYYYGNNTENLGGIGRLSEYPPNSYQVTLYTPGFKTPGWFKDCVMYQIFVDRFYNKTLDVNARDDGEVAVPVCKDRCIMHSSWNECPVYKPDPRCGEILCNDFFGGNLEGVIEKLHYLKDLGIDVIYFNPIFEAFSNHKYDTGDYLKIDPMFGDLDTFRGLCCKAEEMGIRIILDGVFSHTGSDSIYFNKEGRYDSIGAYQSKKSPYYPWYRFIHYPDEYECWWGIKTLPNVNEMEPSYLDFIIRGENSVIKYWLEMGAKGWRLDVVDELPDEFLKYLRKGVKDTDPEAIIIGEVWEDATTKFSYGKRREYLLGEELDSTMNYPWKNAVLRFFIGHGEAMDLHRSIMSLYENYPLHSFYSTMNMVGNHDTTRVKTILAEAPPEDSLSRDQQADYVLTEEQERLGTERLKLVSLFQMTFPGVPCIYYGDEAGLYGYRDPFNRRTYPWGREDTELLSWYKKIISIRHQIDALRTGEFVSVYYYGDVYGFVRKIEQGADVFGQPRNNGFVLVLFNRGRYKSHTPEIHLSQWNVTKLWDILNGNEEFNVENGRLKVYIPPLRARVLVSK